MPGKLDLRGGAVQCDYLDLGRGAAITRNAQNGLSLITEGVALVLPATGTLVTLAGTETLTNKTLTAPTISAPTFSGTAAGTLTSLTLVTPVLGVVTSGNISACTSTSMVMVTPVLGAATGTSLVLTALTGNLTSPILTLGPSTATHAGNAIVRQAHGTFTGAAATSLNGSTQYPANSYILGVNLHITTSFETTDALELGDAGDADRWGNALAITAGTKTAPTDYTGLAFYNGAASNVVLADEGADNNVTAGVAGYTIYYIQMPVITYTP